jgi:polyhydroxybutyrate depolymerase
MLLFHGYSGSPESVSDASGLALSAAVAGWVVVAPEGSGSPSRWAIQQLKGPDDVTFVRAVLDDVTSNGCADAARVVSVGYSNGAGFTGVLTCRLRLVGSAMVGGANLAPACAVPLGYPLVIAHGEDDDVVPVAGGPVIGGALQALPLPSTIDAWRSGGGDVRAVVAPDWGHAWVPGASEAVLAAFATFTS